MSFLGGTLSQFWLSVQGTLFPWLAAEVGELSEKQKQLVKILELLQTGAISERAAASSRTAAGKSADDCARVCG